MGGWKVYNGNSDGGVEVRKLTFAVLFLLLVIPCRAGTITVKLQTNVGDISVALFPDKAPVTVENFLNYVESGFYDGLIFHRVISGFMIQGGGFDPNYYLRDPCEPIINESYNGLSNLRGTIAMARTDCAELSYLAVFHKPGGQPFPRLAKSH